MASEAELPPSEEHVVVFLLGGEYYALEIQGVQEIVRMQPITPVPGSEEWLEGITNLRGRVVPVIDLRKRCGMPPAEQTPETRIVVVNGERGMLGLIVDAVTEVLRIPGEQVDLPEVIAGQGSANYLRGIAKLPDRLVSLMDLDRLIPDGAEDAASDEGPRDAAAA